MLDQRSDAQLVESFKSKDNEAFCALLQRYTEKVHNLSMRITRNQDDAEEVLQDVFLTIFHKIHLFEGKSAFSSWLYRITVNTAFMKLRKRRQQATSSLDEMSASGDESWSKQRSDTSDVNYLCSRHELREALERAITELPEEYKMIFVLRDVDGLSNQEVGEMLSISIPAVKSRLHRSRLMLRRKLQYFYDDYRSEQITELPQAQEREVVYRKAA